MKRVFAIILIVALCLPIAACSRENTETNNAEDEIVEPKSVGQVVSEVNTFLTNTYYGDFADHEGLARTGLLIQGARLLGFEHGWPAVEHDGVRYLKDALEVPESDVIEGVVYVMCGGTDADFQRASDSTKEEYRQKAKHYFEQFRGSSDLDTACALVAIGTFKTNGTFDYFKENLSKAKEALDTLKTEYPGYERYSVYLMCYEATAEYLEYCENQTGTSDDWSTAYDRYDEVMEEIL